jgi:hypothetical protein
VHVDITSEGWEHAIPHGYGITEFIAQVETGTFTITWLLQILLKGTHGCLAGSAMKVPPRPIGFEAIPAGHGVRS